LNKRKVRRVIKYLVQWKGFTAEHDSWEREEDLKNTKELVAEFEKRVKVKVRRQEKLDQMEERDFRREELPERYTARMLYEWDDGKFKDEYLRKLERNWRNWKGKDRMVGWKDKPTSSSKSKNLEGRIMSELQILNTSFFIYFSILELRVRVRVTISCCHISVISDDMVISHET